MAVLSPDSDTKCPYYLARLEEDGEDARALSGLGLVGTLRARWLERVCRTKAERDEWAHLKFTEKTCFDASLVEEPPAKRPRGSRRDSNTRSATAHAASGSEAKRNAVDFADEWLYRVMPKDSAVEEVETESILAWAPFGEGLKVNRGASNDQGSELLYQVRAPFLATIKHELGRSFRLWD